MGLSREEQETVITYDRAGDVMSVYTADPYLLGWLKRQPAYTLVREHKQGGQVVAADFEADKKLLTLRTKPPARQKLTEEQKAEVAARLKKGRQEKA